MTFLPAALMRLSVFGTAGAFHPRLVKLLLLLVGPLASAHPAGIAEIGRTFSLVSSKLATTTV